MQGQAIQPGAARGAHSTTDVVVWVAVLIGAVLVLGFVILAMRRKLLGADAGTAEPGTFLEELRGMQARGEITPAEFESMRRALREKLSGKAAATGAEKPTADKPVADKPAAKLEVTKPDAVKPKAAASAPTEPAKPVVRLEAEPGYDLTGQPLPEPRRAAWQWVVTGLAAAVPMVLLGDLFIAEVRHARGALWTLTFSESTYGAQGGWMIAAMVLAAVLAMVLGALTLGARRREADPVACLVLGVVMVVLPLAGIAVFRMTRQADLLAGSEVAGLAMQRHFAEAGIAAAVHALCAVGAWAARRRYEW